MLYDNSARRNGTDVSYKNLVVLKVSKTTESFDLLQENGQVWRRRIMGQLTNRGLSGTLLKTPAATMVTDSQAKSVGSV